MSNDGTQDEAKNLSLESLDKVVGGTGALLPIAKRPGADPDVLTGAFAGKIGDFNKPSGGGFVMAEEVSKPFDENYLRWRAERGRVEEPLEQALKGKSAAAVGDAFDNYLKGPKGKSLTPADWAVVYDCILGSGSFKVSGTRLSADVPEVLKAKLRPYTEQITRGIVESIDLPNRDAQTVLEICLERSSDVAAKLISKNDVQNAADEIANKAKSGFELGLNTLKGMREYKAVADLIDNPKSEDAWKTAMFEVGISAVSPTKITVVKFLADQMATTAVLKHIGLGQYDPQAQQGARAMLNAMNTATDAVVDLYKNGFVAALTMGLDVKGLVNIGNNVADFGKAVGKGDVDAMGRAAKALVVDALNDVKDGLEKFYVGGTIKVANWTKDLTMGLLNDLGATPYAEMAVQETKKAFVDFGNKAKAGSEAAVSALADFATKDVAGAGQQAINTLGDLAKSGVREAEKAANALGDVAKSGARHAESAVNTLGDLARSGGRKAEAAVNTLGDVAKSGVWIAESAVNTLGDVAKSGLKEADKAVNALGDVAKTGARHAESAINTLGDIGKSGVREAEKAINTLADIGKAGGAYANVAIDELKNLSGHVESAANALERVARSGVRYAEGAWKSVKDALEDTWNKIWPF